MYQAFQATQLLVHHDNPVPVTDFNGMMAVCVPDGPVIITKEQAMAFFGLVEKEQ